MLGALRTVKFCTSVLEGLICCHLQQRALPGSSQQERQPGRAAALPGSPSETTADLPSTGVFPSSQGWPHPGCSQLCRDNVLQPDLPPHLPQPLVPADQGNAIRLLYNLDVGGDEAYLQPFVTREHWDCQQVQVELSALAGNLIWQRFSSRCKFRNNSCPVWLIKTSNWSVSSWLYTDH